MSINFSTYHYPPELMNLLIEAIPLLCRSKKDLILFFRGAGVNQKYYRDLEQKVMNDRKGITKYEITRTILSRLNDREDETLQCRREIIKRIVEFEDFTCCWEQDALKAKGAVASVQKIVNVKDSFTRINNERENERLLRVQINNKINEKAQRKHNELINVKKDLFDLFKEQDPHKRGKLLEPVLNNLFMVNEMLLRESFTLNGQNREGIIEQIDGTVEIDGEIYLVEMKWQKEPVDIPEVSQHLMRIYSRGFARGIFISASGYTKGAINTCKDALQRTVITLCKLEEIVQLLEQEKELKGFLKSKINSAILDKNPFCEPLKTL